MLGAIIGDVVGSVYEWHNIKTKYFTLFKDRCFFTDDTVMTIATTSALIKTPEYASDEEIKRIFIREMKYYGRKYPNSGYGGMFGRWIFSDDSTPYNSFGNGSAMRVSPCAFCAKTLNEALRLAKLNAEITHSHPDGIRGAQATAAAIFLARAGRNKREIKNYIENNFYTLDKTLDEIRPNYTFDETCIGTVPPALTAFFESESFEDAIRNAISLGGDSDTLAAITGSVAWAYYDRRRDDLREYEFEIKKYLPDEFINIIDSFLSADYQSLYTAVL